MADVELLPLPSPQVPFIDCDPSMMDIRRLVRWYEQGATEHARANVAHATAARDAEIEALRAEVERLRADRDSWEQQASDRVADWHAEYLRAERLAEALREWWSAHRPVGWTEDQHRARPYVNLITVADKALTEALLRDQEEGHEQ